MTEVLPSDWKLAASGDLFELVTSGSRGWAKYYADDGPAFIRIGNLDHGTIDLDLAEIQHVQPPAGAEGARTRLQPDDILISITAELGMVGLVPSDLGEAYINQHVALARPRPENDPRFLAWYLASDADGKRQLQEMRRGATKVGLGLADIRSVQIPLPPLDQQRRIVEKIEALTAKSRRAKEALDAIPPLLKRFRQSVLAAAFRGDLTKDWREQHPDVEPADQLLVRIRQERRHRWEQAELEKLRAKGKEPKNDRWKAKYAEPEPVNTEGLPGLPTGWCWESVDALTTRVSDGVHKKPSYVDSGVPFVTVKNMTAGPGISFESLNYISEADHAEYIKRTHPERGDVLISKDGTLGVVRLIETDEVFSIFVSVALMKPILRGFGSYLAFALATPQVQGLLVATGSGLKHIHLTDLRATPVPIPPAEEQSELCQVVADFSERADGLDALVKQWTSPIGQLDQSILAKAFRGELVR